MKILKSSIISGGLFGLVMGIFIALFFIPAIIYEGIGVIPYLVFSIVIVVISTGSLFGLLMGIFVKVQSNKYISFKRDFAQEHDIIYDGAANYVINREAVGGWLFLTPIGLFFITHKYNMQKKKMWIYIRTIKSISIYKSFGIIKNGLLIDINNESKKKFIVNDPNIWAARVNELISSRN